MTMQRSIAFLLILLTGGSLAIAQPTTAPAQELLGLPFESMANGIMLRPPAGCKQIRGAVGTNEVVRFVNESNKWVLKVSRVLLEDGKPLPLSKWQKDGREYPGMFDLTVDQFKNDVPAAQILRQDTGVYNNHTVGLMVAKYDYGLETNLSQQAVLPASDQQYFIIAMTTPAPRTGDLETNPGVQLAVHVFNEVLDSVNFVDQTNLKIDRDDRLLRTRLLFVNLNETHIRQAMQRSQWQRIVRANKDIGYSYIVEEVARDLPRKGKPEISTGPEGILIGIRSRLLPEAGVQVDSESWYFSTFDRKKESFSNISYTASPSGKVTGGDLGVSQIRQRMVIPPQPQGLGSPRPEPVPVDEYKLEVTRLGRNVSSEPVVRLLPPYYLPQAVLQMLPRLLDRREAKNYLIATWVPEASQVMFRYIDVLPEQPVVLGNKRIRAVPIKDKVGLEGAVTTHYVSPEGEYLGSVNDETQISIIATDQATLQRLWKDANLQRPGDVDGR